MGLGVAVMGVRDGGGAARRGFPLAPRPPRVLSSRADGAECRAEYPDPATMLRPIRAVSTLLPLLLVPALGACRGDADAALRVGDIAFPAEEVGRLSPEQLASLADLTALGLTVARDETGAVAEPLAERAGERARVRALPWALAVRDLGLDEAQLRQAYATSPEWELTVRHIVRLVPRGAPAAERDAARGRVEEARRRALAGEDFAALAAEFSDEPGAAERGGLLQPGREGTWVEPFWRAAGALEPGGTSPVVETQYGYHVLRLDDRRPVPFEEADRGALFRRVIPEPQAADAMARWAEEHQDAVRHDREAILAARRLALRGEAPDTLVLTEWAGWPEGEGGRYTAADLARFRAALAGEESGRLDATSEDAFVDRVRRDAEEAMWAEVARRLGVGAPQGEVAAARQEHEVRVLRWAQGLGFRPAMAGEEIRAAALRGLAAGGQEARIARAEVLGMRPLLWKRYGVSGTALPASAAASSSLTRKSEITGWPAASTASRPSPSRSTSASTARISPPASRSASHARSALPPLVITSSTTTTRCPASKHPSIRFPAPCALASLRTEKACTGRASSALACAMA
jgi:hypothetical protein